MKNRKHTISMASQLAPEDVRPDMYVTVHEVIREHPTFFLCPDGPMPPAGHKVRLAWRAVRAGTPYRVKAVCLPYVLVYDTKNDPHTFDVRRHRLVRLDDEYGRQAWHAIQSSEKRKRSRKRKRDGSESED